MTTDCTPTEDETRAEMGVVYRLGHAYTGPYCCEHADAIVDSACCGPIRKLLRSHGIDAEAFVAALAGTSANPPAMADDEEF